MAGNPYKTQEFVSRIHVWLQDVDPVWLRGLVQKEGLISFDQLERLRKIKDIAEHNAELISILCPGGTKSYLVLCSVIHQMGYIDQYLEMLRIVASPEQDAQLPIALQPGAGLACSSTGKSPTSMSDHSTMAENTYDLSETCASAPTPATTTHPIVSTASTSTGSFTADGNAAGTGNASQQSTKQHSSLHLKNAAQLAAERPPSSLHLEPQAKRALIANAGREYTEEMSRNIGYVSASSPGPDAQASLAALLHKVQYLLGSTNMSEGDSRLSDYAASSDTERTTSPPITEWTEDDLRNARVDVYVDSKLRKSVRGFDGIILDSLSMQHFNETNVMIRSKSRRSGPPRTHVEARGEIRTLITIIIKGSPDDCSKHKIEREVIEHLQGLTNSKNEIQVTFWGQYDSIQVMLLLPFRTLGHLLCLAVHNPELLRGLDI
eukprot:scpid102029/ scgid3212/ 